MALLELEHKQFQLQLETHSNYKSDQNPTYPLHFDFGSCVQIAGCACGNIFAQSFLVTTPSDGKRTATHEYLTMLGGTGC